MPGRKGSGDNFKRRQWNALAGELVGCIGVIDSDECSLWYLGTRLLRPEDRSLRL